MICNSLCLMHSSQNNAAWQLWLRRMIYHSACSFRCNIKAIAVFNLFLGEKTGDFSLSLSHPTPITEPVFHHRSSCCRDPAREFLRLLTQVTGGFSVEGRGHDATFNSSNRQTRGAALIDSCEAGLEPREPSWWHVLVKAPFTCLLG